MFCLCVCVCMCTCICACDREGIPRRENPRSFAAPSSSFRLSHSAHPPIFLSTSLSAGVRGDNAVCSVPHQVVAHCPSPPTLQPQPRGSPSFSPLTPHDTQHATSIHIHMWTHIISNTHAHTHTHTHRAYTSRTHFIAPPPAHTHTSCPIHAHTPRAYLNRTPLAYTHSP